MKEVYHPISCDYYDELEYLALRQKRIQIVFRKDNGSPCTKQAIIRTLQARQGEEFLILQDGQEIRLDQLITVDGKRRPGSC